MKRVIKIIGIFVVLSIVVISIRAWDYSFRPPPINLLPLPTHLIPVDSLQGQEVLAKSSFVSDYSLLTKSFVRQARRAFCGVATSVAILNALYPNQKKIDQSTFFTEETQQVRTSFQVTFGGMTLEELRGLLKSHGAHVRAVHASTTDIDTFRNLAKENLNNPSDFIIVNYQRAQLGQVKSGHISPLAAYHAASDRFLILDVAAHRYPPVWVSTAALWAAMNTIDNTSQQSRGFIIVKKG